MAIGWPELHLIIVFIQEAESRGNESIQPEFIQPIVDEPLPDVPAEPDIPAALTGSLVEGQSQIDLLNALEDDIPRVPNVHDATLEYNSGMGCKEAFIYRLLPCRIRYSC